LKTGKSDKLLGKMSCWFALSPIARIGHVGFKAGKLAVLPNGIPKKN